MSNEFKQEERYVVFKLADLGNSLKGDEIRQLAGSPVFVRVAVMDEILDRLEAAEKDITLKESIIDSLGSELNAVAKERDALLAKVEAMEKQEPAGFAELMPGTGFTIVCFNANAVPIGTKLYLAHGAKGE